MKNPLKSIVKSIKNPILKSRIKKGCKLSVLSLFVAGMVYGLVSLTTQIPTNEILNLNNNHVSNIKNEVRVEENNLNDNTIKSQIDLEKYQDEEEKKDIVLTENEIKSMENAVNYDKIPSLNKLQESSENKKDSNPTNSIVYNEEYQSILDSMTNYPSNILGKLPSEIDKRNSTNLVDLNQSKDINKPSIFIGASATATPNKNVVIDTTLGASKQVGENVITGYVNAGHNINTKKNYLTIGASIQFNANKNTSPMVVYRDLSLIDGDLNGSSGGSGSNGSGSSSSNQNINHQKPTKPNTPSLPNINNGQYTRPNTPELEK